MKSEPDAYAWDQLDKDGTGIWDGVRNHTAKRNMIAMKKGDEAFFYHSNIRMECVGIMEITEETFPDPTADKGSPWVVVRVSPTRALAHPVTHAARTAARRLADMDMIRHSRRPGGGVPPAEGKHIDHSSERPGGQTIIDSTILPLYA